MSISTRTRRCMRRLGELSLAALLLPAVGCVTVAEFRKLENQVTDMQRGQVNKPGATRVADLSAELDALHGDIQRLEGRLEVNEHRTEEALSEAQAARASAGGVPAASGAPTDADDPALVGGGGGAPTQPGELEAYRAAYDAWRTGKSEACVDRFRNFLQTYPASAYADDATYWMADCYFKQGDYKTAVLRYDDVVSRYPAGNKAADALYRQGEALLKLGPGYGKAAGRAFERVLKEYPESARAVEAKRQLDLLGSG